MINAVFKLFIGLVLSLGGFLSYFLYFSRFPALRDFPWVNLPLIIVGLILSLSGTYKIFKGSSGFFLKSIGTGGLVLSIACLGLFSYYVFVMSGTMPTVGVIPAVGTVAPSIVLVDQGGKTITLESFKGKQVVVAFYRGYW